MQQYKQESHVISKYFAPRGYKRMYALGIQLVQRYLSPFDSLIGVIGEAGSGKSALIRGMFPGLELTNDDNGVYIRPLPLLEQDGFSMFAPHTYHVDIRFENGFTQMNVLADAIREALNRGKRVIVEHFDLIYPFLGTNADLLIGVGEEIVITRPTIFGPEPQEVYDIVYESLPYRLMSHSAEDLCEACLPPEDVARCGHGDVEHGFVLSFDDHPPKVDLMELEERVRQRIREDLPITYHDENHVCIGSAVQFCTGPRIHVSSTGKIENLNLLHHFPYDPYHKHYLLIGAVGEDSRERLQKLEQRIAVPKLNHSWEI